MFKTGIVFSVALLALACSTAPPPAPSPQKPPTLGSIERLDPAFDELVPKDAQLEKVAGGFTFIEGPLWRPSGALWFSDVAGNVVRQWSPDGTVTEILNPGGYDSKGNLPAGGYNGSNGMTADKDGAVLLCQHGYRRIVRISKDMKDHHRGGQVPGEKVEQSQRRRLPRRRVVLFHRSPLRTAQRR